MANRRDNHQAARALADWAQHRFSRARERAIADTYGVATRTLWRWKDALDSDPELSALYRAAIEMHVTSDWADQLNDALGETIARLRDLIAESTNLADVTEAFGKLSEVAIAKEMLHGALAGQQAASAAPQYAAHNRDATTTGPN